MATIGGYHIVRFLTFATGAQQQSQVHEVALVRPSWSPILALGAPCFMFLRIGQLEPRWHRQ